MTPRPGATAASLAALLALGCGTPRYVATERGHVPMTFDSNREFLFGPSFCGPTCAFAKRPGERLVGCDLVGIDPVMQQHLGLSADGMIVADSMILCEYR
jgi:hypothetical protein